MKKINFLFFIILFSTIGTISAQSISFGGQLGWSIPQGGVFKPVGGEKSAKGGLAYDLDALFLLPNLDEKLGIGLTYKGDLLFGSGSGINLYTLQLYGVKGYYIFLDSNVTPYAALSLGLSRIGTPNWVAEGGETIKGGKASSFGLLPEVGVQFGSFFVAANYLVPMKYKLESGSVSAGSIAISVGYRYNISF